MPQHNWFEGGQWNATCDVCGRAYKSSQLVRAWDNSMRCYKCFETRQPQDFVRAVQDSQHPPWTRRWQPQTAQIFTTGISNGTVTVSLGDAAQLPQPAAGQYFVAVLSHDINREVVSISNVDLGTGILTFNDRGMDGTLQQIWPIGTTLVAITSVLTATFAYIGSLIIEPGPSIVGTLANMGSIFPFVSIATGWYVMATLTDFMGNIEQVNIQDHTFGSPNTFSIARGQRGTAIQAWQGGLGKTRFTATSGIIKPM